MLASSLAAPAGGEPRRRLGPELQRGGHHTSARVLEMLYNAGLGDFCMESPNLRLLRVLTRWGST